MTWIFQRPVTATVKAQLNGSDSQGTAIISVAGCTADTTTATNAGTQINKLLDVANKTIVVNEQMTRVINEEAVEE